MSLQFVLGRSGAGKTHYVMQYVLEESKKNPMAKYLVIVPEQYSVQMKKDIVTMSGENGILNVDVLSFLRLAYRVFEERAGRERVILEDVGVSMVLREILMRKKEELSFYQNNCDKVGFVGEIKSILSELIQYGVGDAELDEMIRLSEGKPMLRGKLTDVRIIYRELRRVLQNEYMMAEDVFATLVKEVGESETVCGSVACLDGFMGFTPSQYELLAELLKICKKVYVTVTIDPLERVVRKGEKYELFYESRKHIRHCLLLAKNNRIDVEDSLVVGYGGAKESYRLADSPALRAIERGVFRHPAPRYKGVVEGLEVHALSNPEEEMRFVVKEAMCLVREEGYRYRDVAIVTGDIGGYGRIAEWEMAKVGIPCFVDNKREVTSNAFVETVLAAIEMLRRDFTYESVFRFLRQGFTGFAMDGIDRMENYVLANGIKGLYRYAEEWSFGEEGGTAEPKLDLMAADVAGVPWEYKSEGERVNELRATLYRWFQPLANVFAKGRRTVAEYTKSLYQLIEKEMACSLRVEEKREAFEANGERVLAKEYEQIYSVAIALFDQLVELLGDRVVTVREYEELLKAGFHETKVGLVPPGIDQVMVGDVERSRLNDVKALFFVGMNDGVIPKKVDGGGVLLDVEREFLLEGGRELAPTERDRMFLQQFYLYRSLTKPKERLYITYSRQGVDGKSIRPSYMLGKVTAIFPDLCEGEEGIGDPLGADMGMRHMVEGLRKCPHEEMDPSQKEIYRYHFMDGEMRESLMEMVKNAFYERKTEDVSADVVSALYGGELTGSVSRMERYAACAYAYFLTYGLRLSERKEFRVGMADLGERFHRVMEEFSRIVADNQASWRTLTETQLEDWGEEAVSRVKEEQGEGAFEDSMRNAYIMNRIRRISTWTFHALQEQVKLGRFEEEGFELAFDESDGRREERFVVDEEYPMKLKGRIDRLEVCEEDETVYVKVVDYKTGNTQIDLLDLYYGLQIQLVVYLDQAMKQVARKGKNRTVIPAGAFYYQIKDPVIERPANEGDVSTNLLMQMLPSGVMNRDEHVIALMDEGFIGEGGGVRPSHKSVAIPLATKANGTFRKDDHLLDGDEFGRMVGYVKGKLGEYGREILQGKVDVNPYKKAKKTACDYCSYHGVCGFDGRLAGNQFRELEDVDVRKEWNEVE